MLAINYENVQARLKKAGFYHGEVDGINGALTEAAIIAFKESIGLRPRPYIGPLTQEALSQIDEQDYLQKRSFDYIKIAVSIKGLHERRNYSRLKKWFSRTVAWIDPRTIPWCGAFVETCLRLSGEEATVKNPLGARQWLKYGKNVKPQVGAILVFWRGSPKGWQGHVGFYWGEDSKYYYVLGGNQSNAVTITKISKSRLLGARMPHSASETGRKVKMTTNGPVSVNEA